VQDNLGLHCETGRGKDALYLITVTVLQAYSNTQCDSEHLFVLSSSHVMSHYPLMQAANDSIDIALKTS
jgi:hypothetical protein